jgi:BlaI family penicillinase repressor
MPNPHLPGAERDVLACLHRLGQATARAIRETMESYRPMTHGSVVTLLKRLEAKKLVAREKAAEGKAFVYSPTKLHGPSFRGLVKDLLQRVFHGDGVALIASLFETKPPSAGELEKLQLMLNELRSAPAKKGGKSK